MIVLSKSQPLDLKAVASVVIVLFRSQPLDLKAVASVVIILFRSQPLDLKAVASGVVVVHSIIFYSSALFISGFEFAPIITRFLATSSLAARVVLLVFLV